MFKNACYLVLISSLLNYKQIKRYNKSVTITVQALRQETSSRFTEKHKKFSTFSLSYNNNSMTHIYKCKLFSINLFVIELQTDYTLKQVCEYNGSGATRL